MASASSRGWGNACTGTRKTVVVEGWDFNTSQTHAGARATVKVPVRAEIAPIVAYLMKSSIEGGYRIRNGATWGYCCRKIRGGSNWSNHAWALAVDLNSDRNPMVRRNGRGWFHPELTDMPPWLVELWEAWGFSWGGYYPNTADAMHFEWKKTKDEANRLAKIAGKLLLEGKLGVGPDGKAIAPNAADSVGTDEEECEMIILHADGKPARLLAPPSAGVIHELGDIAALQKAGVKLAKVSEKTYNNVLAHIDFALAEGKALKR